MSFHSSLFGTEEVAVRLKVVDLHVFLLNLSIGGVQFPAQESYFSGGLS